MFARVSAGFDWICRTICGEIGCVEWCPKDDDGDDCFDLKDEDPNHIVSGRTQIRFMKLWPVLHNQSSYLLTYTSIAQDYDVDLLPGFIEEMIESGTLMVSQRDRLGFYIKSLCLLSHSLWHM